MTHPRRDEKNLKKLYFLLRALVFKISPCPVCSIVKMRASRAAMLENGSRCFLQKSARTFEKESGENPGSAGMWVAEPPRHARSRFSYGSGLEQKQLV